MKALDPLAVADDMGRSALVSSEKRHGRKNHEPRKKGLD